MAFLIILGVGCVAALVMAGFRLRNKKYGLALIHFFLGIVCLILFSGQSALVFKDGSPVTDIPVGIYNVALVFADSYNEEIIYVGLFNRINNKKEEKINPWSLYQFSIEIFEKQSRMDANILVVTETDDGHKKMNLLRLK